MAAGHSSTFPRLPAVIRLVVRALLFKRVLRKGAFPRARTNKAMNPVSGPRRLPRAHAPRAGAPAVRRGMSTCRLEGGILRTTIFGAVVVEDYVRFMELHTRHHGKQMVDL